MTATNGFQTYSAVDASSQLGLPPQEVELLARHLNLNPARLTGEDIQKLKEEKKKMGGKSVSSYVGAKNGNTSTSAPAPVAPNANEGDGEFNAQQTNVLALQKQVDTIATSVQNAGKEGRHLANAKTQARLNAYAAQTFHNAEIESQAIEQLDDARFAIIEQTTNTTVLEEGESDLHFLSQFTFNADQLKLPTATPTESINQLPGSNQ